MKFAVESEHILYIRKLFLKNRAIYKVMWKIILLPKRPQTAMRYGASLITKAKDTH